MFEAAKIEVGLIDYWRVLAKRRWVVYTMVLVVVTTVTIGSLLKQKIYTGTVRLQIESNAPNVLPFQQVTASVPDERDDFYQTQYGLIQSRHVAREVITSLRLADAPEFRVSAWTRSSEGAPEDPSIGAERVDLFLKRLKVSTVSGSRLVDVSFRSADPVLAARVANRVAETYIAFNTEARYNTSERASTSLVHQIANLQDEIDEKEKTLQGYAKEHGIIPINEKQNIMLKNVGDLSDSLTHAQAVRIEKEARYAAMREADPEAIPEVVGNTVIEDLSAKSAEVARRRVQLSEKFRPDWPEMVRVRREEEETNRRLEEERGRIHEQVLSAAAGAYRAALNEEQLLARSLEDIKHQAQAMSLMEIEYNNLRRDVANRRETLEALVRRQSEASSSVGLNEVVSSNVRIVDPAEVPRRPTSPDVWLNIIMSFVVSLLMGGFLAMLVEQVDNSVKTVEEMQEAAGVPSIGQIPILRPGGSRMFLVGPVVSDPAQEARMDLISHEESKEKISEAFRDMRTALLVSRAGGAPRTILVTSGHPGEGKTAIALNLALTLVQIGRRVLIVDGDLRRPRLHKVLGVSNKEGLSNDMSDTGPVRLRLGPTRFAGLDFFPSGPLPPNPADLLDSERLAEILREIERSGYDHVVWDSPPVLAVADAAIMAGRMDVVVVVVRAGHTPRPALAQAVRRLQAVKALILGTVLNQVDERYQSYRGGYDYRWRYGEESDSSDAAEPAARRMQL